jgi:hypothetical protein
MAITCVLAVRNAHLPMCFFNRQVTTKEISPAQINLRFGEYDEI